MRFWLLLLAVWLMPGCASVLVLDVGQACSQARRITLEGENRTVELQRQCNGVPAPELERRR